MSKEQSKPTLEYKSNLWFRLANNRAVELGAGAAVGAATLAIIQHAGRWADRKEHEERTFERHRDLIEYLESKESSDERVVLRRTVAIGLANYKGISVQTLKMYLHPESVSRRIQVSDVLLELTRAGVMERVAFKRPRKDEVRPTASFVQAITADLERCQQLVGEVYNFDPNFDFAALRATLPEKLRPETLPYDDPSVPGADSSGSS